MTGQERTGQNRAGHIYIHTNNHQYTYTYTYTPMHTCTHTCTYIYMHTHACMHTHTHTHTHLRPEHAVLNDGHVGHSYALKVLGIGQVGLLYGALEDCVCLDVVVRVVVADGRLNSGIAKQ
jgi:hypothetical protein